MRLGYVILYVPDVPAALAFYERAFGLARRFLDETGSFGELETGETALAFAAESLVSQGGPPFAPTRPEAPAPGIEVAFLTQDVAGAYATALAAGAAPALEPTLKPWGQTVAYVRDLNGALVELCTPMA